MHASRSTFSAECKKQVVSGVPVTCTPITSRVRREKCAKSTNDGHKGILAENRRGNAYEKEAVDRFSLKSRMIHHTVVRESSYVVKSIGGGQGTGR